MSLVVIEMPEADRSSSFAETLVTACSHAVVDGQCVLGTDIEAPDVRAVAIVRWEDPDRRAVTISVGLRRTTRSTWLSRHLEFRLADAIKERWITVGLVIATLAGEAERVARVTEAQLDATGTAKLPNGASAPAATKELKDTKDTKDTDRPAPISSPTGDRMGREIAWVEGGAVLDPGFGDAWLRAGGWLRASLRPASVPLFVHAEGRYSSALATESDLGLQWAGAGAGVGSMVELSRPLRAEFHGAVIAQRIRARASDAATSNAEAGSRWTFGARLGIDAVGSLSPTWALVAGAEASLLSTGTVLQIGSSRRGRDASISAGVVVAARAFFR